MSRINRDFFREHIQIGLFRKGLGEFQLAGHDAIIDEWENNHSNADDRFLAYMLATAYHETGRTMQPVRETFAGTDERAAAILENSWKRGRLPWVSEPYWHPDDDDRYWIGRGLVQLTHKANYVKMGKLVGQPLDTNPALAMRMDVAVAILFAGMIGGVFTGRKLADYFGKERGDWVNARRIVNGLDRAADIAGYGKAYYAAISYTT